MTDKKISELTNLTGANVADDDEFAIVDTSAVETKAITASELRTAIGNGNFTVTGNLTVQGTTVTIDSASAQTVDLGDNDKIRLGDGDDLQIYHDGNHSKIVEAGTGVLEIQTNGSEIQVTGGSGTEYLARFINNGAFQAYYDNSLKLATTSTGIDVTGTVTADGLTVDKTDTATYSSTAVDDTLVITRKNSSGTNNQVVGIEFDVTQASGVTTGIAGISAVQPTNASSADLVFQTRNAGTVGERMRIDSSGNVLVGTTGVNPHNASQDAGVALRSDGRVLVGVDGDIAAAFNRNNSDGDIALFKKDGTTVGSISTNSGRLEINAAGSQGRLAVAGTDYYTWTSSALGVVADNARDLGSSSYRFKDLYLSGSVKIVSPDTTSAAVVTFGDSADAATGSIGFWNSDDSLRFSGYNNTERMRIDSSGNLLVGHTSAFSPIADGGSGVTATADGQLFAGHAGPPLYVNREDSDGDIAVFRKDGTTVGSIGSIAGAYLNIGSTGGAGAHIGLWNGSVRPTTSAGGNLDNTLDLGDTGARWRNVYVGGGIEIESGTGNVGVGKQALNSNTASNNTAVGYQAGYSNTTGTDLVAVGMSALQDNTTGVGNVAVGRFALADNTTANGNTAVGGYDGTAQPALRFNTTGAKNVGIGSGALSYNTTANNNTAVGYQAGYSNTTGEYNDAFGTNALDANTTGYSNVSVGSNSLTSNTTGFANTAVGRAAGESNTTASYNVAVGYYAFEDNTTGEKNTALGSYANRKNTTGNYNTSVGYTALFSNTTAEYNVSVGFQAMYSTTTGASNTAVGSNALKSNVAGANSTAVGNEALRYATGGNNTAFGFQAGINITSGTYNTALGRSALASTTTSSFNLAIGPFSLLDNTTGQRNTAIGYDALANNTTASNNAALGHMALQANSTGSNSTAIGTYAGYSSTTNSDNTFLGYYTGNSTTGGGNTFVGSTTGNLVTTGTKNTIIGRYNGNQGGLDIRTSSNNIVLSDGDGNPRLYIDDTGEVKLGHNTSIGDLANGSSGDGISFGVATQTGTFKAVVSRSDSAACIYASKGASPTDTRHMSFYRGGSQVGSISTSSSSTSYNTSSDYRLKENVVELTGATTRLKQLEPKRFNFIADADTTVDGFLAHEVQAIVPEAIHGTKDAVDADGNPVYQGIDQAKLVPLLVATIKELEARITALENA